MPVEEIVERKLMARVGAVLFVLYSFFALDRGNMGFAALEMNRAIGISHALFGLGASVFTLGYLLSQVPAVSLMRRLGANRGLALVAVTWGIISTLSAFIWNGSSFLTVRLLLGIAEAGFHAFIVYYISQLFPRRAQGFALGMILAAVPLSQVVSSPISGLLLGVENSLHGWQWLFLIEGIPSILLGLLCLVLIPNKPADARFLTPAEVQWLEADLAAVEKKADAEAALRTVPQVIFSGRVWALGFVLFGSILTLNTLLFWMPQIIKQLSGADNAGTGLLTALPWATFAVGLLLLSWLSGRLPNRVYALCGALLISGVGFAFSAVAGSGLSSFLGLLIGAFGIGAAQGLFWTVAMQKVAGPAAASAYGVITMIGNGSGVFANALIGWARDATGSFAGVVMSLGLVVLTSIVVLFIMDRMTRGKDAEMGAH